MKDINCQNPSVGRLFQPRHVAIVGASRTPGKVGHTLVKNLTEGNYQGGIFPVNPEAQEVLSHQTYSNIQELPCSPDLALIAVPAALVPEVLEEAGNAGVSFAVVVTSGFSEIGRLQEEKELVNIAHRHGMRVLGPNVFGIYYSGSGMNATFGPGDIQPGTIALVSQSGALGISLIEKTTAEQIGMSAIVSLGNRADLGEVEILNYLSEDQQTEAIILYLEGTQRGRDLLKTASRVTRDTPVIAIKAGRSNKGAEAAASHTGSLAGSDKIYEAGFRQSGILRAKSANQAFNWAQIVSSQPEPRGDNVVIVTNGGGVGVMATDACEDEGLRLLDDRSRMKELFNPLIPEYGSTKNPVDMTGMATAKEYAEAVKTCFTEEDVDALVLLYCMAADQDPREIARAVTDEYAQHEERIPVAISILGGKPAAEARLYLNKVDIPSYEEPEEAVGALGALYRWQSLTEETSDYQASETLNVDWDSIKKLLQDVRSEGRLELLETEAKEVLSELGLYVPPFVLAGSQEECLEAARKIGYPVALKVESADIVHKSEAGGVQLNLQNPAEVRQAYRAIMASVSERVREADISGVSVNAMEEQGREVIIGSSQDPTFGATLMFGLGGIYVEILEDVVFRVAPVSRSKIREMIQEIKGYPLLLGARDESRKDIEALSESLYRVGRLVARLEAIVELDINPLLVKPREEGVAVLDCSITLAEVGS
ncbi:MAG: acetate--CoA ligase family protein [Candidatus Bipolaricaulota bacterium]